MELDSIRVVHRGLQRQFRRSHERELRDPMTARLGNAVFHRALPEPLSLTSFLRSTSFYSYGEHDTTLSWTFRRRYK
jgi:hypothetical protein